MSKQITLIQTTVAALLLAVGTAHAAPKPEVVKLPRVLIVGKSSPVEQKVVQLPRVLVTGVSLNTLQQQQTLASAKPARRI